MTRKSQIMELVGQLEAATEPSRYLDALIVQALTPELHDAFADHVGFVVGGNHEQPTRAPELTGSIDAALALAERLEPRSWWSCLDDAMQDIGETSLPSKHLPRLIVLAVLRRQVRALSALEGV